MDTDLKRSWLFRVTTLEGSTAQLVVMRSYKAGNLQTKRRLLISPSLPEIIRGSYPCPELSSAEHLGLVEGEKRR